MSKSSLSINSENVYLSTLEREDGSGKSWNIKGTQKWGEEEVEMYVNFDDMKKSWLKVVPEFTPNGTFLNKEITKTCEIIWFPTDLEVVSGLLLHTAANQNSVPFQIKERNQKWNERIYLRGIERVHSERFILWGYNEANKCLVRMDVFFNLKQGKMEFFR